MRTPSIDQNLLLILIYLNPLMDKLTQNCVRQVESGGKWRVETSGEVSRVINPAPSTALHHSRGTELKTERTVKL